MANMLFLQFGGLAMLQLKPWSARGAFYHPAVMENCYLHVSDQSMSSPSRK